LKYGKNFLLLKNSLPALAQMPLQGGIHDMHIPLQKSTQSLLLCREIKLRMRVHEIILGEAPLQLGSN